MSGRVGVYCRARRLCPSPSLFKPRGLEGGRRFGLGNRCAVHQATPCGATA
ncbi:MAG: hypothetical protein OJF58_001219 [Enhydrobacter sp.]|nr:MAG: hypothetical protein OJF58_001219 [Enhydrobacter sp.]